MLTIAVHVLRFTTPKGDRSKKKCVMIQLDDYLERDADFAREVLPALADNLTEFCDSLQQAIAQRNFTTFVKAHHKVKTTLALLGNLELRQLADAIQKAVLADGGASVEAAAINRCLNLSAWQQLLLQEKIKKYKTDAKNSAVR